MKAPIFLVIVITITLLLSCNSNSKEKNANADVETQDTVFDSPSNNSIGDSVLSVKNRNLLWQADDSNGYKLERPKFSGIDKLSAKQIIDIINNNYDSIRLEFIKTSHDTIYVHIPNSEMLTERIGSTGAEMFMASSTFSLTELKGIKYVNFDFIEGDHAAPGVYDRSYFKVLQ